jgi:4-hydroxybenzoate polyprenyltransferase
LRALVAVHRFTRFGAAGFTLLLPLLGAVAVEGSVSLSRSWKLLVPATAFHLFAYVLNDVCDLPIDRTNPSRARFPLVEGKIGPHLALWFALAQVPLAFLAANWLRSGWCAQFVLLAAFIAMAAYNLWGKACPVPPLTDALQGLSWAALAVWGGLANQAQPTLLLFFLCGSIVAYILLINGVHGAFHDLENDSRHSAKTTALFLGVSIEGDYIFPGRRLPKYAYSLQMITMSLEAAAIYYSPSHEGLRGKAACILAFAALCGACLRQSSILFTKAIRSTTIEQVGMWHLVCSHVLLVLPYTLLMSHSVLLLSAVVFTVPLLAISIRQWVDHHEACLQQASAAGSAGRSL